VPQNTVISVFGVEPRRIGGGELYARELSCELGKRGWKSVLCYLSEPPEPVRRFLALPNTSLEVLPDSWRLKWGPTAGMARLLRRYRPGILHLYYVGFVNPYCWLGRLHGVRQVMFTDHGSRPEAYMARPARWWKRAATRSINAPLERVFCVSDYNLKCWRESHLLPQERFTRIYNGIDVAAQPAVTGNAFRRKYGIPEERTLITQVSWMIPEKGLEDLLAAARIVVDRDARAHFALVGEGTWREQYMAQAAAMGLAGHVTWTGLIGNPTAEGVYAATDILAHVPRWEEAFGLVIAEAMAAARPVVATAVGGVPELVENGATGFLAPRRDAATIAEKLLLLINDPGLREHLGSAGKRAAEERFDLRKNVPELLEYYRLS
jgi:glycosyltransferase involved in cell wall biosynthesis